MLHSSRLRRGLLVFAPDPGDCGLNFLLEALDQFAVGGDQRLLGLDLGDDGLLGGRVRICAIRYANPTSRRVASISPANCSRATSKRRS